MMVVSGIVLGPTTTPSVPRLTTLPPTVAGAPPRVIVVESNLKTASPLRYVNWLPWIVKTAAISVATTA